MQDLLVFEAPSVVAGFRALSTIQNPDVKIIDASPAGSGRFLILAKGPVRDLSAIQKAMRDSLASGGFGELVDHEIIENAGDSILEAAYSLLPAKLNGALLVIETETVSAMFSAAHVFVDQQKLTPLEIRIRKTGTNGAFAYFTGTSAQCALAAEDVRVRFKNAVRSAWIEVFNEPNEAIRELFEGV